MKAIPLVLLALLGCKREQRGARAIPEDAGAVARAAVAKPGERTPGTLVAAGPLRDAEVADCYAVMVPRGTDPTPAREAIEATATQRGLEIVVEVRTPSEAGYQHDLLRYFGRDVSDEDVAALAKVEQALAIGARGPSASVADVLHGSAACARAGAAAVNGWIYDAVTGETLTLASFDERRPADFPLDVEKLVVVHMVAGERSTVFFESFGLTRFGLPELYMEGIPQSFAEDMLELVNGAAQTLVERGELTSDGVLDVDLATLRTPPWPDLHAAVVKAGGTGRARFTATWSQGDNEGEPGAPIEIELTLSGGSSAEQVYGALAGFFGEPEDKIHMADEKDAELLAASRRAKVELAALAGHFAGGIPEGEQLLVKGPFAARDGAIEWMWVEVQIWVGASFTGILVNRPAYDSDFREGQRVEVRQAEVFDYVHVRADGTTAGNETTRILEGR